MATPAEDYNTGVEVEVKEESKLTTGKRKEAPHLDEGSAKKPAMIDKSDITTSAYDSTSPIERKRQREKKRRDDMNKGLDQLLELIFIIDPELKNEVEERHRKDTKPGLAAGGDVMLSRVELLNLAVGVMIRIHQENEERKKVIAHLTKGLLAAKHNSDSDRPGDHPTDAPAHLPIAAPPVAPQLPGITGTFGGVDRRASVSNVQPTLRELQQQITAQQQRSATGLSSPPVASAGLQLPLRTHTASGIAQDSLAASLGLSPRRPGPTSVGGTFWAEERVPPQAERLLAPGVSKSILRDALQNLGAPPLSTRRAPYGAGASLAPEASLPHGLRPETLSLIREMEHNIASRERATDILQGLERQAGTLGASHRGNDVLSGSNNNAASASIDMNRPGDIAAALQISSDHMRRAMIRDQRQRLEDAAANIGASRRSWPPRR